ncbi:M20/M25/M40 family metallo-hydrolase [Leifsonia sp. TF02-11]|uniref:M20/M25/M40 family metallo-hydrolase n=1 Tax=Leifsonia sp. TF02-11 TaxID=2815212 RepID=UPI001AA18DE0|nr:M20/M25/M40 family metallo-hydrolase [Leifsonia sp. TF02-11]MBO1739240.1 M20/M25/M40 family metallo-hydrolase [Leifsonia sp. TF02-11]
MTRDALPAESEAAFSTLEDEALRFARELIRIPSVNTGAPESIGDGEAQAARYLQSLLEEAGYETEYAESVPGRGNLLARLRGRDSDRGGLLVHAHLDVVPASASDWTHPPFAGEVHDDVLYGRGALDMKGYAGVLVAIARHFARSRTRPGRDLVFAFFADEEGGGVFGVRWLLENRPGWFHGVTEAISEVGGFSVPLGEHRAYLVATAEKGIGRLVLTARGTAGHGSRPTADNAVTRIARAVDAIGSHTFPIVPTRAVEAFAARASELLGEHIDIPTIDAHPERLGTAGPLVAAALRNTVSPTIIQGGYKSNVIPGEARAEFDVRVLPGQEGTLRREVEALIGPGITAEWDRWIHPIESPSSGSLLDTMAEAIRAEDEDGVVVPYLMPASTDNKHLAAAGIAGYGFTPLRTADDFDAFGHFHAVDERVEVDALRFCARVTERILRDA